MDRLVDCNEKNINKSWRKMRKFIIVAGYGWSGSSALVDFFKEFSGTIVPDVEFRLIKDPYGIKALETSLFNNWDFVNATAAIEDFLWITSRYAYTPKTLFSKPGLAYGTLLSKNFGELTRNYISSLTDFEYHNTSIHSTFKAKYFEYISKRILDYLYRKSKGLIGKEDKGNTSYLAKPSEEKFIECTKEYIDKIFDGFPNDKIVVLDQAISPLHVDCLKYFFDAKMIIVDREPTDIYVDLKNNNRLIGKELNSTRDSGKYVQWHNSIRFPYSDNDRVFRITFEDLVLDYEKMTQKVKDFIGWNLGTQSKYSFFDPEVSKHNIDFGICEQCTKDEYSYIREHLH